MKLYRINFPNNKVYIGVTSKELEVRFKAHSYSKYTVGQAIRKYGKENVTIELLFEDCEELIMLAEETIVDEEFVKSNDNYNMCLGGGMPCGVSMKGSDNPRWKGGITPCTDCGTTDKSYYVGRCKPCRILYNEKCKTLCTVCNKPTSRPEYTIHVKCKPKGGGTCYICGGKTDKLKTKFHQKCKRELKNQP